MTSSDAPATNIQTRKKNVRMCLSVIVLNQYEYLQRRSNKPTLSRETYSPFNNNRLISYTTHLSPSNMSHPHHHPTNLQTSMDSIQKLRDAALSKKNIATQRLQIAQEDLDAITKTIQDTEEQIKNFSNEETQKQTLDKLETEIQELTQEVSFVACRVRPNHTVCPSHSILLYLVSILAHRTRSEAQQNGRVSLQASKGVGESTSTKETTRQPIGISSSGTR